MKTHSVAKALNQLAEILKNSPNVEMLNFTCYPKIANNDLNREELALNVTTLLALSKINKNMWNNFIKDNNWPIDVKTSYSSRDLIGKILKFLDSHPDALKKLKNVATGSRGQGSAELLNALSSLMGDK